jgi:hypothetical protein
VDDLQGKVAARFAYENLKARKAALFIDQAQDYCVGLANFFSQEFKRRGGDIVATSYIQTGDQDFSAQISALKGKNPDLIYAPNYYAEDALLAKQLKDLGLQTPILTGDGAQVPELLSIGGPAVDGMYFTAHFHRPWAKFHRGPGPALSVASDLAIAEIGPDRAMDFARPVAAGFAAPPPFQAWLAALPGRAGWRIYAAYSGTEPVAGGALYCRNGVGWLGITATAPAHRRRGAQTVLLARQIADAIATGCRDIAAETGVPVPGEPNHSYANMLRAGFEIAYLRDNYLPVGESPVQSHA